MLGEYEVAHGPAPRRAEPGRRGQPQPGGHLRGNVRRHLVRARGGAALAAGRARSSRRAATRPTASSRCCPTTRTCRCSRSTRTTSPRRAPTSSPRATTARSACPSCITRCGNFFGPGDRNWERLVPGTIRSLLRGERPIIRSDGTMVRDYLYVVDGALAYLRARGGAWPPTRDPGRRGVQLLHRDAAHRARVGRRCSRRRPAPTSSPTSRAQRRTRSDTSSSRPTRPARSSAGSRGSPCKRRWPTPSPGTATISPAEMSRARRRHGRRRLPRRASRAPPRRGGAHDPHGRPTARAAMARHRSTTDTAHRPRGGRPRPPSAPRPRRSCTSRHRTRSSRPATRPAPSPTAVIGTRTSPTRRGRGGRAAARVRLDGPCVRRRARAGRGGRRGPCPPRRCIRTPWPASPLSTPAAAGGGRRTRRPAAHEQRRRTGGTPMSTRWTLLVNDLCREAVTAANTHAAIRGRPVARLHRDGRRGAHHRGAPPSGCFPAGTYNLGSGRPTTVRAVAELVQAAVERAQTGVAPELRRPGARPSRPRALPCCSRSPRRPRPRSAERRSPTAVDETAAFCIEHREHLPHE